MSTRRCVIATDGSTVQVETLELSILEIVMVCNLFLDLVQQKQFPAANPDLIVAPSGQDAPAKPATLLKRRTRRTVQEATGIEDVPPA